MKCFFLFIQYRNIHTLNWMKLHKSYRCLDFMMSPWIRWASVSHFHPRSGATLATPLPFAPQFLRWRFQIKKSLRDWTACVAEMKVWPRHTSDGSDQSWPDAVLKTQMCEYQLRDESEDFSDPASRPTMVARIPRQKSLRRYELMKSNARCGFAC